MSETRERDTWRADFARVFLAIALLAGLAFLSDTRTSQDEPAALAAQLPPS
jgi:hypothetical protein